MDQAELFDPASAPIEDVINHLDACDDPRTWPQTLADLVDVVAAYLQRTKQQAEGPAYVDARAIVASIAHYVGGRQIYLPRDDRLRMALRDQAIWQQFDGKNVDALSRQHKLTTQQIYSILSRQRKLAHDRVQPSLPLGNNQALDCSQKAQGG